MKIKFKPRFYLLVFLLVLITILFIWNANSSLSEVLENDVEVKQNTDLTYYIDVIYDGKDAEAISSSDSVMAKVNSNFIHVEDKIPEGLVFQGFVPTADGTIGAVKRSDETACSGYVVDDTNEGSVAAGEWINSNTEFIYNGLHYDKNTNVVSFRVKNLQAGCKLTVGIVTKTPTLGSNTRMDFFNTADARENLFSIHSNTVHVFMGKEDETLYEVSYQYTGDVPTHAPSPPSAKSYAANTSVGVENDPMVSGYTFSGWSTGEAAVNNETFTMPFSNVHFVGSFVLNNSYTVHYQLSDSLKPDFYSVPSDQTYSAFDDVSLDSLQNGDVVSGYRFLGWVPTSICVPTIPVLDGIIQMPECDVTVTGSFELVTHTVSYQFQGTVLPPDASSLLPASQEYSPGSMVTLAPNPTADGYKFLGWYHSSSFEMPDEDVVVYGEWMEYVGVFSPAIAKIIVSPQSYYSEGETVPFDIVVENLADFPIRDVILHELLNGASFVYSNSYTILSDSYVSIDLIPANSSVVVQAQYIAGDDKYQTYTNVVELIGAIADNDYYLDTSHSYRASASFVVANVSLHISNIDSSDNALSGGEYTLYNDCTLEEPVSTGLSFYSLSLGNTYCLKQTQAVTGYMLIPQTMEIEVSATGDLTMNSVDVVSDGGDHYVSIVNTPINILAETGGPGVIPNVLGGLLLITIGSIGYVYSYQKRRGAT